MHEQRGYSFWLVPQLQGDTLQGVANELDCVLKTGRYLFLFCSNIKGVLATVELHYQPMALDYPETAGEATTTGLQPEEIVHQKWNDEQINDFVRKLGFLDGEGAVGDQINRFLHLNQVL